MLYLSLQDRIAALDRPIPNEDIHAANPVAHPPRRPTPKIQSSQLAEHLAYGQFESCQTLLIQSQDQQVVVLCVPAGETVPTHASLQGTALSVLSGTGVLELAGHQTPLAADVCFYIPAQALYRIQAIEPLSLLCTWDK